MSLSEEQAKRFSKYGMYPFNWIVEGKLLASVYPELEYLRYLHEQEGIGLAVNLTEGSWDRDWSSGSGIECIHFPVEDMTIPDKMELRKVLERIDMHEGPVMVHCAAGIGRTGTLIGVYLVHHGMDPMDAIRTVRKKRPGSIQTLSQEALIINWKK